MKIGPWGGLGGQPRDIQASPRRLTEITIHSDGEHINSIRYLYVDMEGALHQEGPWGGEDGEVKPPVL